MAVKKTSLPRWNEKRGWVGGDTRTLYTFTGKQTGAVGVYPGGGPRGKLLMGWGPEATVRLATRREAEEHWQNPLHVGWKVNESAHATRKYSQGASDKIGRTLHEFKHGQLKSGSGHKVKSRQQAIAIGISQARRHGYKVPPASHARRKKYPYIAYWVHTHRGGSRDSEAVYVLGTTTRADEGLVGHDLRVRPVRLGEGDYTMVVSPDDVKSKP